MPVSWHGTFLKNSFKAGRIEDARLRVSVVRRVPIKSVPSAITSLLMTHDDSKDCRSLLYYRLKIANAPLKLR